MRSIIHKRIIPVTTQSRYNKFSNQSTMLSTNVSQDTTFVACAVFSLSFQAFVLLTKTVINHQFFKVDREDHFYRPGFLHIIIYVFPGYKASNFVKIIDV